MSVLSFILNEFYYFGEQFNFFDENFYRDTLFPVITRVSSLNKLWLLFLYYITNNFSYQTNLAESFDQTNLVDDVSTNGLTWPNPMIGPTRSSTISTNGVTWPNPKIGPTQPSWLLQKGWLGQILCLDQLGRHSFYKQTNLGEPYDRTNSAVNVFYKRNDLVES